MCVCVCLRAAKSRESSEKLTLTISQNKERCLHTGRQVKARRWHSSCCFYFAFRNWQSSAQLQNATCRRQFSVASLPPMNVVHLLCLHLFDCSCSFVCQLLFLAGSLSLSIHVCVLSVRVATGFSFCAQTQSQLVHTNSRVCKHQPTSVANHSSIALALERSRRVCFHSHSHCTAQL